MLRELVEPMKADGAVLDGTPGERSRNCLLLVLVVMLVLVLVERNRRA
jgi:hypothetical protein